MKCVDETGDIRQILLPQSVENVHDHAGHQGVERTLSLPRKMCFWLRMVQGVQKWCKDCKRCMIAKATIPSIKPPMRKLIAYCPWKYCQLISLYLRRQPGNVLVVADIFFKFTQAIPTRDQKDVTVAKTIVKEWFVCYGIPHRIHSDAICMERHNCLMMRCFFI